MGRIGFTPSYMQDEEVADKVIEAPLTIIANEGEQKPMLTNQHLELLGRIEMVERVITGKQFAKMSVKKKKEYLDELRWLTELNQQLIKSY
jgi:hypothetical protein